MAFQVARARRMLDEGAPLIRALSGRARWAVAGFWAGGQAALDAVADRGFDPLRRSAEAGAPPGRIPPDRRPAGPGRRRRGSMNLDEAYRRCEEITTTEARNFSYGIKLLPPAKRQAMSALYALARRIDDIGDGDGPVPDKLAALADARKDVAAVAGDDPYDGDDPVLVALADVGRRFAIPLSAFDDLIDGCEMDVHGRGYRTFDDLVGYCRRVAGSIGRLSLGVYGTADPERARPLADDLGVALQITNILRGHRRGPRADGPRLPPRRGPGTLRRGGRPRGDLDAVHRAHQLRGRPGRGVVRAGAGAAADARLAVACLHRRHGRHLPPAAGSASSATRAACSAAASRSRPARRRRWPCGPWRGGRHERTGPQRSPSRGGRRWAGRPGRRPGLRRPGRPGDAARTAQPARRSDLVLPARRPLDRQRPARVPPLLRQYLSFLDRIGARSDVELPDRLDLPVAAPAARPGGPPRIGRLRRARLPGAPAPGRVAVCATRISRWRIAWRPGRAMLALRRLRLDDPALDEESFGSWLARHGQSPASVAALWDLITVPTVNLPAREASLAMAAKVFQTGLLDGRRARPTSAGAGCPSAGCTATGRGPPSRGPAWRSAWACPVEDRSVTAGRSRVGPGDRFTVTTADGGRLTPTP